MGRPCPSEGRRRASGHGDHSRSHAAAAEMGIPMAARRASSPSEGKSRPPCSAAAPLRWGRRSREEDQLRARQACCTSATTSQEAARAPKAAVMRYE
eukprot:13467912-Alexandrium_andersonii.AAC.1